MKNCPKNDANLRMSPEWYEFDTNIETWTYSGEVSPFACAIRKRIYRKFWYNGGDNSVYVEYLPSKKVIVVLLLLFFGTAMAFLVTKYSSAFSKIPNNKAVYQRPLDQLAAAAAVAAVDTDQDGLKDWEEALWKTDAKNTDSDKDGLSDGDEVKTGRNPAKAGPDDKLDPKNTDSAGNAVPENLSETDKVAREFFARYLQASDGGKRQLSIEEQEQLALEITSRTNTDVKETYYLVSDIKKVADSRETKLAYAQGIVDILSVNRDLFEFKDLLLIKDAFLLEEGVERDALLKKLNPYLTQYQTAILSLQKIPVPESLISSHLTLLNAHKTILESERKFAQFNQEPLSSLAALKGYQLGSNQMTQALVNLKLLLASDGISFPFSVTESMGAETEVTPEDFI